MRRKIFSVYTVSIIMLALCFIQCKQEKTPTVPQDYHIKSPENILSQYNAGRPEWDWSQRTTGTVKIDVRDSIIIMEHFPLFEPEMVYYFLQTEHKAEGIEPGFMEKAEVFFLDRHLVVNSLESNKRYLFTIGTEPLPDYLKGIENATLITGYGIGAKKVTVGGGDSVVPICSCEFSGYPIGGCNATELNAVHCVSANDAGSCRVTCSGQTFACCDKKPLY